MDDATKIKVLELWQDGNTGAVIASLLGLTRNQVIGFIYRFKQRTLRPNSIKKEKITNKKEKKKQENTIIDIEPEKMEEYFAEPTTENISIDDLKFSSCRFIVEDGGYETTRYCGKQIYRVSYCKDHYALCYFPPRIPSKDLWKGK